jgi:hypothetical protein
VDASFDTVFARLDSSNGTVAFAQSIGQKEGGPQIPAYALSGGIAVGPTGSVLVMSHVYGGATWSFISEGVPGGDAYLTCDAGFEYPCCVYMKIEANGNVAFANVLALGYDEVGTGYACAGRKPTMTSNPEGYFIPTARFISKIDSGGSVAWQLPYNAGGGEGITRLAPWTEKEDILAAGSYKGAGFSIKGMTLPANADETIETGIVFIIDADDGSEEAKFGPVTISDVDGHVEISSIKMGYNSKGEQDSYVVGFTIHSSTVVFNTSAGSSVAPIKPAAAAGIKSGVSVAKTLRVRFRPEHS